MRRIAILCVCLGLFCSAGCSFNDAMFGVFGNYYSDGTTRAEREANYHRELERWGKPPPDSPWPFL